MEQKTEHVQSAEQKFTRYHSVRRANNTSPTKEVRKEEEEDNNTTSDINRSRSRYHKQQQPDQSESNNPPTSRSQRTQAAALRNGSVSRPTGRAAPQQDTIAGAYDTQTQSTRESVPRQQSADDSVRQRHNTGPTDRAAHRSQDGLQQLDSRRGSRSPRKQQSHPDSRMMEHQTSYEARKTMENEEKGAGCFGIFKRRRKDDEHITTEKPQPVEPLPNSNGPAFIKQGGGGIVPGTDAPKSAVNAGERRVLVECQKSSIQLPVKLDTTPEDLLRSAANVFSEHIDPKTYVLLEYFAKVGVQRPLRRYENVRDVMNSWDDDGANSLIVVPAAASGSDPMLLHLSNVPKRKPQDMSFIMYYSQKVGKWDRRHITIRQDGQMVASKSSGDKDATNMCHLSDFDIYTPTARQMSKKIKPPKKICFAIKSLEKTSMFESTTNFVHFLCTSEKYEGINFYTAVQGWRSWYLVNMMGEGQKQARPAVQGPRPLQSSTTKVANTVPVRSHQPSNSIDSHYLLGSFKPIDASGLENQPPSSQVQHATAMPIRKVSVRDKKNPAMSHPRVMQLSDSEPLINLVDKQRGSIDGDSQDPASFTSNGLLGRTYSQRQRTHQMRENTSQQPFTDGPSLLNTVDIPRRTTSTRQAGGVVGRVASVRDGERRSRGSIDLARSGSKREPPRPLIDLTPTYQPPPQHLKKSSGKGYHPEEIGPGGLIENATSPETAIEVPSAVDWRGRNDGRTPSPSGYGTAAIGTSGSVNRPTSGRTRSTSRSRAPQPARFQNSQAYAALHGGAIRAPERSGSRSGSRQRRSPVESGEGGNEEDGFIAGGLLAHAAGGQGGSTSGRGVGGSGRGPLVDMNEGSKFGKGSLLERVERENR